MPETVDFTRFQDATTVFLTMYEKVKINHFLYFSKPIDFTGFTSTFSQKICFSFNGI